MTNHCSRTVSIWQITIVGCVSLERLLHIWRNESKRGKAAGVGVVGFVLQSDLVQFANDTDQTCLALHTLIVLAPPRRSSTVIITLLNVREISIDNRLFVFTAGSQHNIHGYVTTRRRRRGFTTSVANGEHGCRLVLYKL